MKKPNFLSARLFFVVLFLCFSQSSFAPPTSVEVCRLMLTQIAQSGDVREFLNCPASGCEPLLHQAIKAGDWAVAEEYLKWGADPAVRNADGKTAYELAEAAGNGGPFQGMVGRHRPIADVRDGLAVLGIHGADADTIINRSPSEWPAELRPEAGYNSLFQRATREGDTELVRYLVEVKGHPLVKEESEQQPAWANPTRWVIGDSGDNYKLWSMALLADDGGKFFRFLQDRKFPVLENYNLAFGMGPLSLFIGHQVGVVPEKFRSLTPAFDREKFAHFLKGGIDPSRDGSLMTELMKNPETHAEIWKALAEEDYPQKATLIGELPQIFAAYFDLKSATPQTLAAVRAKMDALGVDLAVASGDAHYTALFSAASREMAQYLVKAGVDPNATAMPTRGMDAYTAGEFQLAHLELEPRGFSEVPNFRQLLGRMRTERLSSMQAAWDEGLARVEPAEFRDQLWERLQAVDYLLHDAQADVPTSGGGFVLGTARLGVDGLGPAAAEPTEKPGDGSPESPPFRLDESTLDGPDLLQ
ncbi:MAG: ankyrin repeat domain-containing protein [Bdellovibrionales bacterium]|nr:ankyrin repeat domain-containing protein [Bdellovibrionales bacterium]